MATTDNMNGQPDSPTAEMEESAQAPGAGNAGQPDEPAADGNSGGADSSVNMEFLLDIPLEVTVELGRTKMLINDMLKLGQGSVIELPKEAGDTLEILANNRLVAKGDVVVVNKKYGIRLTEVISPVERVEKLG